MWLRGIEDNVSVALPPFFFLWNVPESSRGQVILTCCHCFTCSQLPACENLKFSLVQFPASFEQCCNEIKTTLSGWYLMKTDWWWEPRYLRWIVFERTKRTRCTLLYWVFQTCSMFLCFIKTHLVWLPTQTFAQDKSVPFTLHIGLWNMPSKCLPLTRVQLVLLQTYIDQCCQPPLFFYLQDSTYSLCLHFCLHLSWQVFWGLDAHRKKKKKVLYLFYRLALYTTHFIQQESSEWIAHMRQDEWQFSQIHTNCYELFSDDMTCACCPVFFLADADI